LQFLYIWIFTADSENAYLFSVNFHGGYNLRLFTLWRTH